MYTLYIDTHFVNLVIGLFKNDSIAEKQILESNKHSENTINLIEKVLSNNNIKVDDLSEIIVVNGPGSFTGVRIGVVIAKIMGFSKNIKVKTISYLEALALNYNEDVTVGIKDRNGAFIGNFNKNHHLTSDYKYLSNDELSKYKDEIKFLDKVDLNLVYKFMKSKEAINPHNVKPLYVKKIEVDK